MSVPVRVYQNKTFYQCLLIAAKYGDCETIEYLIGQKQQEPNKGCTSIINMNVRDDNNSGFTPLHKACWYGHYSVVQLLLNYNNNINNNVNINILDDYGRTSLHLAAYNGYTDIVQYLIRMGAKLYIKTTKGNKTALDYARENGDSKTIQCLELQIRQKAFTWLKNRRRNNNYYYYKKQQKSNK